MQAENASPAEQNSDKKKKRRRKFEASDIIQDMINKKQNKEESPEKA